MNKEIERIAKKIAQTFHPLKIILFGSSAKGETTEDSDIDICIIEEKVKDKYEEMFRIRKSLSKLLFPLDIVLFSQDEYEKRKDILGTVQYEIAREGKVLYER